MRRFFITMGLNLCVISSLSAEPESASVSFEGGRLVREGASWLIEASVDGGVPGRTAWVVEAKAAWGSGKLLLRLAPDQIRTDLAMSLIFEKQDGLDFIVQLLDADGRVVALDLFSNVAQITDALQADTLVIPLKEYPTATQVVIRRLSGCLTLYGASLVPVAVPFPDGDPMTVLDMARLLGDSLSSENPVVKVLRKASAKAALTESVAKSSRPREPFFKADSPENIQRLIEFFNRISVEGLDFNADCFVRLASDGELEMVNLYLKAGMPVGAQNGKGKTACTEAAQHGRLEVVKFLIARGVSVNAVDRDGRTLLYSAVRGGKLEVVNYLLSLGADPNIPCNDGGTPLYIAMLWSSTVQTRNVLISAGADVNYRAPETGMTVLMKALQAGHSHVRTLLEHGADVHALDNAGRSVLDYAYENGNTINGKIVQQYGGGIYDPDSLPLNDRLIMAAKARDFVKTVALLKEGADPNYRDSWGRTALIWSGHKAPTAGIIRVLLAAGADVNATGNDGRTALIGACIWNMPSDCLKMLLDAGADPDIQDKDGTTALMTAAWHSVEGHIKMLLEYGANPDLKDKNGNPAAIYAKAFANEYLQLVLKYYRPKTGVEKKPSVRL